MNCKGHEEGLTTLAEGGEAPETARHVAECSACAARLEALRRVVAAARRPVVSAPAELIARAQALMPSARRRSVVRLLGGGLAPSGARRGEGTDFSLHLGVDDRSIRLQYVPAREGWTILGRVPGEGWRVRRGEGETLCDASGRFRIVVPSLDDSAFILLAPGEEIEVPSARELLGRDV